ncbi:ATP-binding protein/SpoIIE family protein phosphatase [Clostridium sp. CX1]|uniref:ATP-binding SpoIIE family protein phosphatase n=1 Tax=Clostridium sp. CX1 TaxID=2978346 RepID=UPI0021C2317D|nr:ATP-binding SpoIIE family protein phosphatase [Clostridium sp. CX1]MCT8977392.1 ATP-binding protein/SpoIIE family protein phosphatase [Clostridium sp. CX1]
MNQHISIDIIEKSNVGELRRVVSDLGKSIGLTEENIGKLSIITNEMSTNILKHAGCSGKVITKRLTYNGVKGIEVISIDSGVGIKNIGAALRDGFSTAGSMGTGLGAIKRLSQEFDIYSQPEKGTIVMSRVWEDSEVVQLHKDSVDFGVFSMAKPGQEVCGDDWLIRTEKDSLCILVSDALGHGEGAAKTSREAVKIFIQDKESPLEDKLLNLHEGLKGTRGAAIAIAHVNLNKDSINYIGVGNISGRIFYNETYQSCISTEGIVGANMGKYQRFTYKFFEESVFIMNTDGFATSINFNHYPGILNKKSSLIAALIYRDFSTKNDDMAVVVVRNLKRR